MTRPILPPFSRLPPGAGKAARLGAYLEYCEELVFQNPGRFLPVGQRRRWWNLKAEHPLTDLPRIMNAFGDMND